MSDWRPYEPCSDADEIRYRVERGRGGGTYLVVFRGSVIGRARRVSSERYEVSTLSENPPIFGWFSLGAAAELLLKIMRGEA